MQFNSTKTDGLQNDPPVEKKKTLSRQKQNVLAFMRGEFTAGLLSSGPFQLV